VKKKKSSAIGCLMLFFGVSVFSFYLVLDDSFERRFTSKIGESFINA
jgi:hypothetical protein